MYFIHISGFDELLCLLICCRTRKICTRRTLSSFESFPIPKKISTRWRLLLAGCAQKALKSKPEHITCLCFWSMEEVKACWLMEGKRPFCRRELPVSSDTGSRCHTSSVEQSFSSSWWGTRSSVNHEWAQSSGFFSYQAVNISEKVSDVQNITAGTWSTDWQEGHNSTGTIPKISFWKILMSLQLFSVSVYNLVDSYLNMTLTEGLLIIAWRLTLLSTEKYYGLPA